MTDEDWERLKGALVLPESARSELVSVIDQARAERLEALAWSKASEIKRLLDAVSEACAKLRERLEAAMQDEAAGWILRTLEKLQYEYVPEDKPLLDFQSLLTLLTHVEDVIPAGKLAAVGRPGPLAAGLQTLVYGAADIIWNRTNRLISRSYKTQDVAGFNLLYEIAQLPGGADSGGASVEASMRQYITDFRRRKDEWGAP